MIQAKVFIIFLFLCAISFVSTAFRTGSETFKGLGKRKQQILNTGGGVYDIAIDMLETRDLGTDYKYGDGKTGDSANFGIFKQKWFMLRTSTSQFKKYNANNSNLSFVLSKKLAQDFKARQESQKYYGADKWFAGHRNGESGLNNPYTQDITDYKNGVNWIHSQLINTMVR